MTEPFRLVIPRDAPDAVVRVAGKEVRLTNLSKPFWPELGITKGGLLQYYADVSLSLLPPAPFASALNSRPAFQRSARPGTAICPPW